MARPSCPDCKRTAVIANSHVRDGVRVKVFGCVRCGKYGLGKDVAKATDPRTRAVIGNNIRDRSGRFVSSR